MLCCIVALTACEQAVEHTAPAVNPKDSMPTMVTYGVNTLISDSGVVKYRIVTERYEVNQVKNPPRWTFDKGVFRSDERMTKYYVSNSKGSFARTDIAGKNDSLSSAPDTLKEAVRPSAMPQRKLGG